MAIREYLKTVMQGVKTYVDNGLAGKADSSHGTHVTWSTTTPKANGTASVGSETKVARGDHIHPTDTTRAAASDLTSHTGNKSNPHGVTKAQVGLGNVENKSSATIRGELTKDNVTTALGYTPPTQDTTYSEATTTASGLMSKDDKVKLDSFGEANTYALKTNIPTDYAKTEHTHSEYANTIHSHSEYLTEVPSDYVTRDELEDLDVGSGANIGKSTEGLVYKVGSTEYVAQVGAEIFNNYLNMAAGQYSHAEGTNTKAFANASHAEGQNTTASGVRAHAEGYGTTASSNDSHAEGFNTTAASSYQHVQGKYNIVDRSGTYAHIVGNGANGALSNAHTLDWNGNAWFKGDVFIGGTTQAEGKQLATQEYVDSVAGSGGGASGVEQFVVTFKSNTLASTPNEGVYQQWSATIDKTHQEVYDAYTSGKYIIGIDNNDFYGQIYKLVSCTSNEYMFMSFDFPSFEEYLEIATISYWKDSPSATKKIYRIQNMQSSDLGTTEKTIIGAINEIVTSIGELDEKINSNAQAGQSNWDESDENDPTFIQNKPFYAKEIVLIPEGETRVDEDENGVDPFIPIESYNTDAPIFVKWNGIQYECEIIAMDGGCVFGNTALMMGSGDTGEPFVGLIGEHFDTGELCITLISTDGSQTANVKVWQEDIKKLNNKFIDAEWTATYNRDLTLVQTEAYEFKSMLLALTPDANTWLKDLSPSKKYLVKWNDIEYETSLTIVSNNTAIIYCLGNVGILNGNDNGVPFVIVGAFTPDLTCAESVIYKNTNGSETVNVQVYDYVETINELPPEFLPSYLPYYKQGGVILKPSEFTSIGDNDEFAYPNAIEGIEIGEVYTVNYNGVDYECTAVEESMLMGIALPFLGNIDAIMETGDNGIPFAMWIVPSEYLTGAEGEFGALLLRTDDATSVTVGISVKEVIRTLDSKMLPEHLQFGEVTGDILPLNSNFEYEVEEDGTGGFWGFTPIVGVEIGKTYTVNYNGVDYDCVANGFDIGEGTILTVLGNAVIAGGEDTGEPFAIVVVPPEMLGEGTSVYSMVISYDGATTLTLSISSGNIKPIDTKYLPEQLQFGNESVHMGEVLSSRILTSDEEGLMVIYNDTPININKNEVYTITWNNVDYNCTPIEMEEVLALYFGNTGALGVGEDTGEPFIVVVFPTEDFEGDMVGMAMSLEGLPYSSLAIKGNVKTIEKLDDKYIDSIWLPKRKLEGNHYVVSFSSAQSSGVASAMFLNYQYSMLSSLSTSELCKYQKANIGVNSEQYICIPFIYTDNNNALRFAFIPEGYTTENAPFILTGAFVDGFQHLILYHQNDLNSPNCFIEFLETKADRLPIELSTEPIVFTTNDMQAVGTNKSYFECKKAIDNNFFTSYLVIENDGVKNILTFQQISCNDAGLQFTISAGNEYVTVLLNNDDSLELRSGSTQ